MRRGGHSSESAVVRHSRQRNGAILWKQEAPDRGPALGEEHANDGLDANARCASTRRR